MPLLISHLAHARTGTNDQKILQYSIGRIKPSISHYFEPLAFLFIGTNRQLVCSCHDYGSKGQGIAEKLDPGA